MLLYTFPVLFMAVVGSVYLHLRKKSNQNRDEGYNSHFISFLFTSIILTN